MRPGHVLIGKEGQLVSVDRSFGDIMQLEPASLIGRLVLDVTAPADREECRLAISDLRETGRPFEISKRCIRSNGSLVWVTNAVSALENGKGSELLVATVTPMIETHELRAPARLLDTAHLIVALRKDRSSVLNATLSADIAWDIILAAYIAEAEGNAITVSALAAQLGIPMRQAYRWIGLLLNQGSIEIETRETDPFAPKSFRLTGLTHVRFERYLSKVGAAAFTPKSVSLGAD